MVGETREKGRGFMTDAGERPLVNYHTHTWRCLHAEGTEEEYVRRAIDTGFSVLGFADHTPWPYESGYVSGMRMRLDQLEDYLDTVKASSLDYVILGNHYDGRDDADHDAFSDGGGFYFGRCGEPAHVRRYAERTIAGMRTGLFDYVAHPDLYCHLYPRFDAECAAAAEDICVAAKALDIPLEYNLLGVQYHAREAGLGLSLPAVLGDRGRTGLQGDHRL